MFEKKHELHISPVRGEGEEEQSIHWVCIDQNPDEKTIKIRNPRNRTGYYYPENPYFPVMDKYYHSLRELTHTQNGEYTLKKSSHGAKELIVRLCTDIYGRKVLHLTRPFPYFDDCYYVYEDYRLTYVRRDHGSDRTIVTEDVSFIPTSLTQAIRISRYLPIAVVTNDGNVENTSQLVRGYTENKPLMSIGIVAPGETGGFCMIPWKGMGTTYDMRMPRMYLTEEDLYDIDVLDKLDQYEIDGCYIGVPLKDYSFLSSFSDIKDLHIRHGEAIRDLSFLESLTKCHMLYMEHVKAPNLDILASEKMSFIDVGLYDCQIEDASGLVKKPRFGEFLVWSPKSRPEKQKWWPISAHVWKYYEIDG